MVALVCLYPFKLYVSSCTDRSTTFPGTFYASDFPSTCVLGQRINNDITPKNHSRLQVHNRFPIQSPFHSLVNLVNIYVNVVVVDYATICALDDDVFVVGGSVDDCGRGDDDAPQLLVIVVVMEMAMLLMMMCFIVDVYNTCSFVCRNVLILKVVTYILNI